MLFDLQKDEDALLADVPDPMPTRKSWVTRQMVKGFQKPGTGREMGSELDVRLFLEDVATVVFCRDVSEIVFRRGAPTAFSAHSWDCVTSLRNKLNSFSDKKLDGRVFSLATFGHVGLVAKFGRNGPRDGMGRDQAAAVELSFIASGDTDVVCACRCAEQCLRLSAANTLPASLLQ